MRTACQKREYKVGKRKRENHLWRFGGVEVAKSEGAGAAGRGGGGGAGVAAKSCLALKLKMLGEMSGGNSSWRKEKGEVGTVSSR